jgi:cell division septation protein DedD
MQSFSMIAEISVLLKVGGQLTHRQESMEHEQDHDQSNNRGNDTRVALPKNKLSLEHPRHPPHGVVADEDGRDERHVAPHEQTEKKPARALCDVKPRRPVTLASLLVQCRSGDDIDRLTHDKLPAV